MNTTETKSNRTTVQGTVLLRTMARKSLFKIGKYENLTVQEVLNMGDTNYIAYSYFCLSNISFTEDILAECEISNRIPKPGCEPSALGKWNAEQRQKMLDGLDESQALIVKNCLKLRKEKRIRQKYHVPGGGVDPKWKLRNRNQGHCS